MGQRCSSELSTEAYSKKSTLVRLALIANLVKINAKVLYTALQNIQMPLVK